MSRACPPALPATHFLWLSVRVMPWADTLKCTTVDRGGGRWARVALRAFCTAWWPVSDSISREPRYHTLQAADGDTGQHVGHGPALGAWGSGRLNPWPCQAPRRLPLPDSKARRASDPDTHGAQADGE